jgi:F0F1-type ATP synthase epsilon subunit
VPEAFPLAELDESAIRNGYAEAQKNLSASAENSAAKAIAQIELDTFAAMARAIGSSL